MTRNVYIVRAASIAALCASLVAPGASGTPVASGALGQATVDAALLPLSLVRASAPVPVAEPATPSPTPTSPATAHPPPTATPPPGLGHHAGEACFSCHAPYMVAGTVFTDGTARFVAPGVPVALIRPDGGELVLDATEANGNLSASAVPDGAYLVRLADVTSRTWHVVPGQGDCNTCHVARGNGSALRTKRLGRDHTQLPPDNACTHCHHFPASMALEELRTDGVLNTASLPLPAPASQVRIAGRTFPFDPADYEIETVRPDIFAPGYFSVFDAILAVAERNGLAVEFEYDADRATHFITRINGRAGDYWYHFSYDTGSSGGNERELAYRRANRWDETLWRPGVWVQVVEGEDLATIKREYLVEVERERARGHVVPLVRFAINPRDVAGNPPGSGRITVQRVFRDVVVTAHDLRATHYPSPYSKPFQPGVVTSLDILLSLHDEGALDVVTSTFYTHFNGSFIDSYYVVAIGFPDAGTAHASGRQGFVYITENGAYNRLPNGADRKFHITADISVIHAPDFSYWRWIELGNPYYERDNPGGAGDPAILEDHEAVGRGFSLHAPVVGAAADSVEVRFNIFEPLRVRLHVRDAEGRTVAVLHEGPIADIGWQARAWRTAGLPAGRYEVVMESGPHVQVRTVSLTE